jgi:predicted nucleotidyltransferase
MVCCKRRVELIPHMMARILGPSNSRLILERIDLSALSLGSARGLGLYGSWARGTNHQESDLDIWIRADSLPPESVLARLQRDLSHQADSEVNLLVLTPEKLERLKIDDAPFYNSLVMSSVTLIGGPLEEYR